MVVYYYFNRGDIRYRGKFQIEHIIIVAPTLGHPTYYAVK
jgi:hypothetical protein